MEQKTTLSLQELGTRSPNSIITSLRKHKRLIIDDTQAVLIPQEDYKRYRHSERIEMYRKEAEEAKAN